MTITTAGFVLFAVLALPARDILERRRRDSELRHRRKARRIVKA
jgi:hypothetical protein